MNKHLNIIITLSLFGLQKLVFAQSIYNLGFSNRILEERSSLFFQQDSSENKEKYLNMYFNQYFYSNSNLPNLENLDGLYMPKGFGHLSGFLFNLNHNRFEISAEPTIANQKEYQVTVPNKEDQFSVLNDTRIENHDPQYIKNIYLKYKFYQLYISFGNTNKWFGPGIHNSLVMSNNAKGFYNYSFGTNKYVPFNSQFEYKFDYHVSKGITNSLMEKFYLSTLNIIFRYKTIELGISKNILSGGYPNFKWDQNDAFLVMFTNKNSRFWNTTTDTYLKYKSPSGLIAFLELGRPKRYFGDLNVNNYNDHNIASIIGLRKYGIFNRKEFLVGIEYARLVQSIYYNIMPSPNWFDDIKYNYHSYNQRRWTSHSGADSDDLLLFTGIVNTYQSIIVGINYERHGVTYNFPPEVKIEFRFAYTLKYKNLFLNVNYENEYYRHYGFIDSSVNVWTEEYEKGSVQRTKTILLSLEYKIF